MLATGHCGKNLKKGFGKSEASFLFKVRVGLIVLPAGVPFIR